MSAENSGMRKHLALRFAFFILGIVLLYAPFALLTKAFLIWVDLPLKADAHQICLRMPISWLFQPWMYSTMISNPTYLVAVLFLPALAFFLGPLFCGWMCPPGMFTEYMSRLVPDKLKIDLSGRLDPSPIRYGVLAAMLLAPFFGAFLACSFCNFFMMQNVVNAAFGNFHAMAHWASFTFLTFALWFVIGGLFTKGGRGWCNFLCPAGALMGLAHAVGARLRTGFAVRVEDEACKEGCSACVPACPAWAISRQSPAKINLHMCNGCMDCAHVCPNGAISYKKKKK